MKLDLYAFSFRFVSEISRLDHLTATDTSLLCVQCFCIYSNIFNSVGCHNSRPHV